MKLTLHDDFDDFEGINIAADGKVYIIRRGMSSQQIADEEGFVNNILYVSFNQDFSGVGVGHEGGYLFHTFHGGIDTLEHLSSPAATPTNGDAAQTRVCIIERLFSSSLFACVSINQTRRLHIIHSQRGEQICSTVFTNRILAVRMNRKVIVICLDDQVVINDIRSMQRLHKIADTPNRQGIIELASEGNILAFPGDRSHVVIFDTETLSTSYSIPAHTSPIAAICLNPEGTVLATASVKGTVIRIFDTKTGSRLYEFARGMKRCVTVSSMAFSCDSKYLCLSSNTDTVHVFHLENGVDMTQRRQQQQAPPISAFGSIISTYVTPIVSPMMPTEVNEIINRSKSVATARLPTSGTNSAVAMRKIDGRYYILVATIDGYLFCYQLDTDKGECPMARQHRIGPNYLDDDGESTETSVRASRQPVFTNGAGSGAFSASSALAAVHTTSSVKKNLTPNSSASSSPLELNSVKIDAATASNGPLKPAPPPIPPAPKKRSDATAPPPAKSGSALMAEMSTNPFEMDDDAFGFNEINISQKPKSFATSTSASSALKLKKQIIPSKTKAPENKDGAKLSQADLEDMSQFPPL